MPFYMFPAARSSKISGKLIRVAALLYMYMHVHACIHTYPDSCWFEVLYVAHDSPARHQHEEVGEHVLFLRVPEWISKFSTVLQ